MSSKKEPQSLRGTENRWFVLHYTIYPPNDRQDVKINKSMREPTLRLPIENARTRQTDYVRPGTGGKKRSRYQAKKKPQKPLFQNKYRPTMTGKWEVSEWGNNKEERQRISSYHFLPVREILTKSNNALSTPNVSRSSRNTLGRVEHKRSLFEKCVHPPRR